MSDRLPGISAGHMTVALIGAATQLVAGFFVAFSSLLAPPWGVAVLWAVWIATSVWGLRNWRRRVFAPLISVTVMVLFWVAFLNFGDHVLGWTA